MSMSPIEKIQMKLGCVALLIWLTGVGLSITVAVLVIRALLKYIGS